MDSLEWTTDGWADFRRAAEYYRRGLRRLKMPFRILDFQQDLCVIFARLRSCPCHSIYTQAYLRREVQSPDSSCDASRDTSPRFFRQVSLPRASQHVVHWLRFHIATDSFFKDRFVLVRGARHLGGSKSVKHASNLSDCSTRLSAPADGKPLRCLAELWKHYLL